MYTDQILLYYITYYDIISYHIILYHMISYYIILILGFNLFQAETFADAGCSQQSFFIGQPAGLGSTWRIIKGSWARRKMVTGRLSIETEMFHPLNKVMDWFKGKS